MLKRQDVYIRDPFIVPVKEKRVYYMFGTTDKNCWGDEKATGFDYYVTSDLENFDGPYPAFRPPQGFWADRNFWAPEVHFYNGKYYMFATFCSPEGKRGTQVLVSSSIEGPYIENSKGPITPPDWMCLDGTLYIDQDSNPWLVFCHEWVEVYDGEIWAARLSDDLKRIVDKPVLLFTASNAPWTTSIKVKDSRECFVTDGPFLFRTQNGSLLMLWSSFDREKRYCVGVAKSLSGDILGPWQHKPEPIFLNDGGHGMLFRTFEGELMLSVHSPNSRGNERPLFVKVDEKDLEII